MVAFFNSLAGNMDTLLVLCLFGFIAGFVDAIAGGGGLIQLPAYFILMPQLTIAQLLGSNKLGGFSGTFVSTIQYLKEVSVQWRMIVPSLIAAGICSLAGAQCVSFLNKEKLAPFIIVLLIIMLVQTSFNRKLGMEDKSKTINPKKQQVILFISSCIIGLYDGFFGPGAGSLLMFVFIGLLHFDFLSAAAHTKVFNCVTNIGALLFFIVHGDVQYAIALPVAACNVTGNYLGSKLAIKKGSTLIRTIYIFVVIGLIAKLSYDYLFR